MSYTEQDTADFPP